MPTINTDQPIDADAQLLQTYEKHSAAWSALQWSLRDNLKREERLYNPDPSYRHPRADITLTQNDLAAAKSANTRQRLETHLEEYSPRRPRGMSEIEFLRFRAAQWLAMDTERLATDYAARQDSAALRSRYQELRTRQAEREATLSTLAKQKQARFDYPQVEAPAYDPATALVPSNYRFAPNRQTAQEILELRLYDARRASSSPAPTQTPAAGIEILPPTYNWHSHIEQTKRAMAAHYRPHRQGTEPVPVTSTNNAPQPPAESFTERHARAAAHAKPRPVHLVSPTASIPLRDRSTPLHTDQRPLYRRMFHRVKRLVTPREKTGSLGDQPDPLPRQIAKWAATGVAIVGTLAGICYGVIQWDEYRTHQQELERESNASVARSRENLEQSRQDLSRLERFLAGPEFSASVLEPLREGFATTTKVQLPAYANIPNPSLPRELINKYNASGMPPSSELVMIVQELDARYASVQKISADIYARKHDELETRIIAGLNIKDTPVIRRKIRGSIEAGLQIVDLPAIMTLRELVDKELREQDGGRK